MTTTNLKNLIVRLPHIFCSALAYLFNIAIFYILTLGYGCTLWATGKGTGWIVPTIKSLAILLALAAINHYLLKKLISFRAAIIIESLLLVTLLCILISVMLVWLRHWL